MLSRAQTLSHAAGQLDQNPNISDVWQSIGKDAKWAVRSNNQISHLLAYLPWEHAQDPDGGESLILDQYQLAPLIGACMQKADSVLNGCQPA